MLEFLKKLEEYPILGPLLVLLKSPDFLAAVATLIADAIIATDPRFAEVRTSLITILTTFTGLLISGHLMIRIQIATGTPIWQMPLFGPIFNLLRSRKFIVAAATLAANVIIAQVPELQPVRSDLLAFFTILGTAVIGGIAYEDGKKTTDPKAAVLI